MTKPPSKSEALPDEGTSTWGKPVKSSAGKPFGWNRIYDDAGNGTPYMTRFWIGRLRFHIFHRGDADPDCHDHPWDFWTFPLTPYVEEVVRKRHLTAEGWAYQTGPQEMIEGGEIVTEHQIVPAWWPTFRAATHTHRVLGRVCRVDAFAAHHFRLGEVEVYQDEALRAFMRRPGPIVTVVWRSKPKRSWGFLKNRDGKWCWVAWKEYVFGGGKDAACQ